MLDTLANEPRILRDDHPSPESLCRLLDITLRGLPGQLLYALNTLGGTAIDSTPEGPGEGRVVRLLEAVLEQGLDQEMEFDDDTEDALASDPAHRRLIDQMRAQKPHIGKKQIARPEDNPQALDIRDIIRRRRIGVLALRRMQWNNQQPEESCLPEAC